MEIILMGANKVQYNNKTRCEFVPALLIQLFLSSALATIVVVYNENLHFIKKAYYSTKFHIFYLELSTVPYFHISSFSLAHASFIGLRSASLPLVNPQQGPDSILLEKTRRFLCSCALLYDLRRNIAYLFLICISDCSRHKKSKDFGTIVLPPCDVIGPDLVLESFI